MRHIIWAISYGILYKIHKPNVTALQETHNTGISLKDCFIFILTKQDLLQRIVLYIFYIGHMRSS